MSFFSHGLSGWRRSWKSDLRASVSVAFIAIPLGLGIGLASGVPPIAAITPCLVGGLFLAWFSGGHIIVHSTPKMLISVTAAAVVTLGGNDLFAGYRFFLAAVVIAGLIQFLLGIFRLGVIGEIIPATVVKALLASVGVIIIMKQLPIVLGGLYSTIQVKELTELTITAVTELNVKVFLVGLLATALMFIHPKVELPVIKAIPAPVWVVILSIGYTHLSLFLSQTYPNIFSGALAFKASNLVEIPTEIQSMIVLPDFSKISSSDFWSIVLAVSVISSLEGILSAKAIDRLDSLKRKSNVNRELRIIGIGSSISGMVGGLPIIPAIVSSSVAANHNAKSMLADFFHAVIVLALVLLLASELNLIPLAALSGILIHTGYKLINPGEIKNIIKIGWDQLLIFSATLGITLASDLIVGITAGTALTLMFHMVRLRSITKLFNILFRPNVLAYEEEDNTFHVSVKGYSNFLNYSRLKKALDVIPHESKVVVDLSLTEFVDHTVMEHLSEFEENHIRRGGEFDIIGIDSHLASTSHSLSVRYKDPSGVKGQRISHPDNRNFKLFLLMSNGDLTQLPSSFLLSSKNSNCLNQKLLTESTTD
jgi:MFS superfamily sulfate permease-like transporter